MDIYTLHALIDSELPSEVHARIVQSRPPKLSISVTLTDWHDKQKYFQKVYDLYSEDSDTVALIIEDMKKFTNYWNSPLMKALR